MKIGDRSLALKVELCVKKLSKDQKERIVMATPDGQELLHLLGLSESVTT